MRTLKDKILIKQDEMEEKTASGIFLPNMNKKKPNEGVIIEVGTGTKDDPMEVEAGERVIFRQNSGTKITLEEQEYVIITQSDILIVL